MLNVHTTFVTLPFQCVFLSSESSGSIKGSDHVTFSVERKTAGFGLSSQGERKNVSHITALRNLEMYWRDRWSLMHGEEMQ